MDRKVVIFDNGSRVFKAGFQSDEQPSCMFPNAMATGMDESLRCKFKEEVVVGEMAELMPRRFVKYPVEHGVVVDWNAMEVVWSHAFTQLRLDPSEYSVLLTEAPWNSSSNREAAAKVLFEKFGVAAVQMASQSVLSLLVESQETGLVLDIGGGGSSAVAVLEGKVLPSTIQRQDVGGVEVTSRLLQLLKEAGTGRLNWQELQYSSQVPDIKESTGYVALDIEAELNPARHRGLEEELARGPGLYTLPDGDAIVIGDERFRCAEVLFDPSPLGVAGSRSVAALVMDAVGAADADLRAALLGKVVLAGGGTMMNGFPERLTKELKALAPDSDDICVVASSDRKIKPFVGGLVATNLSSFQDKWVTKQEYEERGAQAVHDKCY